MKPKLLFWTIVLFLILLFGFNMAYAIVNAQFPLTLVKINETLSVWNISNSFVFLSDSSNRVGIGTTTPSSTLTVKGNITSYNHSIQSTQGLGCSIWYNGSSTAQTVRGLCFCNC